MYELTKIAWLCRVTPMKKRLFATAIVMLFSLIVSGPSLFAQDNKKTDAQQATPSIQQQIDQLKEGQERMLREIAEIKRLVSEKPSRVDMPAKPAASNPVPVNVHGEPFRGDGRARFAIMEYSDFECSFCAKYVREIYPRIDKDYIHSGKIKYFFRDLPGPGDTNALLKARAARCAGEQGKFWEMHDRLFATQTEPVGQNLASHAETLGLDAEKFSACLASGRYSDNIGMSVAGARRIGVFGTPAFLIGTVSEDGDFMRVTKILVGGESFETLKSSLDELLVTQQQR